MQKDSRGLTYEQQLFAEPVTLDDRGQGPRDAKVTLLRYGDYQCPYTRMARLSVHPLQRELPERLRFVNRHFPLDQVHPRIRTAASAAAAAGAQIDFWLIRTSLRASTAARGE
jgi:protein-disulfide isomerase